MGRLRYATIVLAGIAASTGLGVFTPASAALTEKQHGAAYCWVVLSDEKYHDPSATYTIEATYLMTLLGAALGVSAGEVIVNYMVDVKAEVDNDLATRGALHYTPEDCAQYAKALMKAG